MRIALDATYSIDPHPSGIAVYSRELMEGLAAAHPDDRFLHCYRARQFLRSRGERPLTNVRRKLLVPPIPAFGADLFHALNQRVDRRPAQRVISTFHDLFVMTGEYSSPEFRARFQRQAQEAAANSDLIIAVSEFTASQVSSLLAVPRSRIRVVHHGVRAPKPADAVGREKMVLFVGALQVRKNIARLVAAFEHLPRDWTLTLAGAPSGFAAAEILQRIEASPARGRIKATGYVTSEQLEALYAKAGIFAFPSLDEGFGMPVLEAMARGVPVLTSSRSALPEVAGGAALLVNPFESDEIAAALESLVNNPSLRQSYAEAGRRQAGKFTWKLAVERTYEAYRALT